jgi:hypothetical protein
MLDEHNLAWVPSRNTTAAQDAGMHAAEGDALAEKLARAVEGPLGGLTREMHAVGARLEQLEAAVGVP